MQVVVSGDRSPIYMYATILKQCSALIDETTEDLADALKLYLDCVTKASGCGQMLI
jgi:hypothetical protein